MGKWNFDNSYARLPRLFYSRQEPVPVLAAKPVIYNHDLAGLLDVPLELNTFAGNQVPIGAETISQAYAGHQFGHFTMLGDGRAVLLGEHVTPSGARVDVQLKGSGRTPYSRRGDGRAALAPMLREYIISEAMYALGVPTTRSLAVMLTGENIMRETELAGAVLTRIAASHIRVGTFEYAAYFGSEDDVRILADYTITRHFQLQPGDYVEFLRAVVKRQAELIAKWQLVGFVHGVMNTDNMAISGETIDYGPCAFMDAYDPATVFSSIDIEGRYAYKNQPKMAMWNLARFAETLLPLLHEDKHKAIAIGKEEVKNFEDIYYEIWLDGMRAKLGFEGKEDGDEAMITEFLQLTRQQDYTNTFRLLTLGEVPSYLHSLKHRLKARQATANTSLMKCHNPVIIPRNHHVEKALAAAVKGDLSVMERLLEALRNPYEYTQKQDEYITPPAQSCTYKTFCGT